MASVLVVDDCPDYRLWARRVLQDEGLEVLEASDVLAGLQRAVEDTPDLVILSLELSGLDGLDACERISMEPASRDLPILVVTDEDSGELRSRAREAGASAVVVRSFRAADLCGPVIDSLWAAGVSSSLACLERRNPADPRSSL